MTIVKLNPVELTTLSETKLMQHCNSNVLLGEWRFIEMQEYAGETMYLWFEVSKERIRSDHYLPPQPSSLRLSLQSVPLLKGSCKGDSMIYLTNENSNIEKISFHYWHGHKVNVDYFFCVDQDNSDIYHFSKGNLSLYCFSILSIEVCIANCRWCFFFQPFLTIVICDVHFSL